MNYPGSWPSPAIRCKSDLLEIIPRLMVGGLCCEKSGDYFDSCVEGVTRSESVKKGSYNTLVADPLF